MALETIRHPGLAGEAAFAPDGTHHLGGQRGLGVQGRLVGHLALVPSLGVGGAQPLCGYTKSLVHQGIARPRGLGGAHPHVTLFPLPQRPTVLPRHAHRLHPFFDKARLLDHHHALRITHLVRDEAVIRLTPRVLIPPIIAHAALHAPHVAPVDVEGHGLKGFAFQGTALADHGVEDMRTGLTPRTTPPALVMERLEFVKKSVNLTRGESKRREGAPLVCGTMCR
jgi:hypothetical protein